MCVTHHGHCQWKGRHQMQLTDLAPPEPWVKINPACITPSAWHCAINSRNQLHGGEGTPRVIMYHIKRAGEGRDWEGIRYRAEAPER